MTSPEIIASPVPARPGPEEVVIQVENVNKTFGPTHALIDVNMSVVAGEARALVGRNGAGKSTLVSILTGLQRPDRGRVMIDGGAASTEGTGVACVYQHSRLVPALTVAENMALGDYPRRRGRLIDWRRVHSDAVQHLEAWELSHLAGTLVEDLDPVQKKVVEVCRALTQNPRVLLLDEPTAGLDRRDAERLFEVVDRLKADGVTLLYVSHHLEEIYRLCDSATVLRDARLVVTSPLADFPMRALVSAMVGEDAPPELTAHSDAEGISDGKALRPVVPLDEPVRLKVTDLRVEDRVDDFSLEVRRGECVGVAGLEGSGKAEIGAVLAGLLKPSSGTVAVDDRRVGLGNVRSSLDSGIAYVPPDRHARGMVLQLSVSENATMTAARSLARRPVPGLPAVLLPGDRDRHYQRLADQWEIVASSPDQLIGELSGGNQQKCVMARGIATDPVVLVLHNPTAGIDVAAKASITRTLGEILEGGACGVVISEDPDDFALCARVLVVVKGRVSKCLDAEWTEAELVSAMQGVDQ